MGRRVLTIKMQTEYYKKITFKDGTIDESVSVVGTSRKIGDLKNADEQLYGYLEGCVFDYSTKGCYNISKIEVFEDGVLCCEVDNIYKKINSGKALVKFLKKGIENASKKPSRLLSSEEEVSSNKQLNSLYDAIEERGIGFTAERIIPENDRDEHGIDRSGEDGWFQ